MNINLKKTQYDSRFEGLLLTIVSGFVCGIILYGVLTNALDESNMFIIAGFSLFAGALLLGIWKLINKKSSGYVDVNGWKYRVFKKVSKNKFIFITGGVNALGFIVILALLYFFKLLALKEDISIQFVLLMIFVAFIITVINGYGNYKKYTSIDMNSKFE